MDKSIFQQAIAFIRDARTIVIVPPKNPDGDIFGACGALSLVFSGADKNVHILTSDPPSSYPSYTFLPLFSQLFQNKNEAALCLNCPSVSSVRYEKTDRGIVFFIAPGDREIEQNDIVLKKPFSSPDLLITIGIPDRKTIGGLFPQHTEFFFAVPTVNIDNNPANEQFGTVNLVSPTSSSRSEIAKRLIEEADGDGGAINENAATYLLFGIISATKNFQAPKTSPSSLLAGASLILKGARHQDIIQHLYKTKPFEGLKALGEVMHRLQREGKMCFASFTRKDLAESSVNPPHLLFAAKELKEHFLNPLSLLLLWEGEKEGTTQGILFTPSEELTAQITQKLGGTIEQGLVVFSSEHSDLETTGQKLTKILLAHT